MTDPPIRLTLPFTDEGELAAVAEVLASGYLTQGPKVAELETAIAELVGAGHAFATTSATTALHLSLAALGVSAGDEVLVPDFTFPATANVVVQLGARPVLVDVDRRTFSMDPEQAEAHVTARTVAMMPVHPFGLAADMDPLQRLCDAHGLRMVEDAACALATTYFGRPAGTFGDLGCFSFHPRKSITTGEGGMIVTSDDVLADRISVLRNHGGRREHGRYRFEDAGYNYRLSDILAAVGVAQLRKLERIVVRRRELAAAYDAMLADLDEVLVPFRPPWQGHVFQSYVVTLADEIDRDAVIRMLADRGIETTIGTYALHAEPYFAREFGYQPGDLPESWHAYRQTLTLPLFPQMTEPQMERVLDALRTALRSALLRPPAV